MNSNSNVVWPWLITLKCEIHDTSWYLVEISMKKITCTPLITGRFITTIHSTLDDQAFVQPSHIYSIQDGICRFPANLPDMSLANITLSSQCFLKENRGYLALAYDSTENVLYYSENVTRSINRVRLEHKSTTEAIISGVGVVEGKVNILKFIRCEDA